MEFEPNNAQIFRLVHSEMRRSLNDMFRIAAYPTGTKVFDGVPKDGTEITKRVDLKTDPREVFLDSDEIGEGISRIGLAVKMYLVRKAMEPDVAVRYSGSSDSGSIQHAEYEFTDDHGGVRLHFQQDSKAPSPTISVQVRSKDGLLHPATLELIRTFRPDGKPVDLSKPDFRIVDL